MMGAVAADSLSLISAIDVIVVIFTLPFIYQPAIDVILTIGIIIVLRAFQEKWDSTNNFFG